MHIFITGHMGYVGPSVVRQLRSSFPEATLTGFDTGYFSTCLTGLDATPESLLDKQYRGDVRRLDEKMLAGVDAIVHLAAISNDPMGNQYEQLTFDVNYEACIALAKKAKNCGVKQFVFASSCSVYGCADQGARSESSEVNPLTAYAKSKVMSEQALVALADTQFKVTCLRFPTACGMSGRLRLDLVLNDFVASAFTSKKITILSDGTPWRPLINVKDMARAIDWAVSREGDAYLVINAGSDDANYRVSDLARAVADRISGVEISINQNASPDKRSYQVSFQRFRELAGEVYQPRYDLDATIDELKQGLEEMEFSDSDFRNSFLIRLNYLNHLRSEKLLDEGLFWVG